MTDNFLKSLELAVKSNTLSIEDALKAAFDKGHTEGARQEADFRKSIA